MTDPKDQPTIDSAEELVETGEDEQDEIQDAPPAPATEEIRPNSDGPVEDPEAEPKP